jgi:DNA-binding transcriptional ArsR family regulator
MVSYGSDDDLVFRALADGSRRELLDRLHRQAGQSLGELCQGLDMTRPAVAKHLRILEEANLVSVEWRGR